MFAAAFTLLAALSLVWPLHATASPGYPAVLEDALELGCSPGCGLCHVGKPGYATVNTPLGRTLRKASLRCCDDDGLVASLTTLETRGTDSDGDGVGDVDELRSRDDPNTPDAPLTCERAQLPDGSRVFGTCAATPHAAQPTGLGEGVLLLAAVVLVRRLLRQT